MFIDGDGFKWREAAAQDTSLSTYVTDSLSDIADLVVTKALSVLSWSEDSLSVASAAKAFTAMVLVAATGGLLWHYHATADRRLAARIAAQAHTMNFDAICTSLEALSRYPDSQDCARALEVLKQRAPVAISHTPASDIERLLPRVINLGRSPTTDLIVELLVERAVVVGFKTRVDNRGPARAILRSLITFGFKSDGIKRLVDQIAMALIPQIDRETVEGLEDILPHMRDLGWHDSAFSIAMTLLQANMSARRVRGEDVSAFEPVLLAMIGCLKGAELLDRVRISLFNKSGRVGEAVAARIVSLADQLSLAEVVSLMERVKKRQHLWQAEEALFGRLVRSIETISAEQVAFTVKQIHHRLSAHLWDSAHFGDIRQVLDDLATRLTQIVETAPIIDFDYVSDALTLLTYPDSESLSKVRQQAIRMLGRKMAQLVSGKDYWRVAEVNLFGNKPAAGVRGMVWRAFAERTAELASGMNAQDLERSLLLLDPLRICDEALMIRAVNALAERATVVPEVSSLHMIVKSLMMTGVRSDQVIAAVRAIADRRYTTFMPTDPYIAAAFAYCDFPCESVTRILLTMRNRTAAFAEQMDCCRAINAAMRIDESRADLRNLGQAAMHTLAERIIQTVNDSTVEDFSGAIRIFSRSKLTHDIKLRLINAMASAARARVDTMTIQEARNTLNALESRYESALVQSGLESQEINQAVDCLRAKIYNGNRRRRAGDTPWGPTRYVLAREAVGPRHVV